MTGQSEGSQVASLATAGLAEILKADAAASEGSAGEATTSGGAETDAGASGGSAAKASTSGGAEADAAAAAGSAVQATTSGEAGLTIVIGTASGIPGRDEGAGVIGTGNDTSG